MASALRDPVERFLADITPVLRRVAAAANVSGRAPERDVAVEAYNLAAAFIDADGRHTDDELWAFLGTFAPHFSTMLQYATPADARAARLVEGKQHMLTKPSVLFDILLADDRRSGNRSSWRYYEHALAIAHAVAALDLFPSDDELGAINRFRSTLLAAMDAAGVPRPGTTATAAPPVTPPPLEPEPELPPPRPLEELLAELDGLVGLAEVKAEVKLVADLIQVQNLRRQRDLPVVASSRHLVFTGNPGTGKTTVARLLAQIYRTLEVVEKGHLVETDRSGLVAGYVGQTALRVREVVDRADGGMLLIDEAYALARGGERDFGREAIDTLVKLMEDRRDSFVVVVAGYPNEMDEFVESNPGLRSRFPRTIAFPDYTSAELVAIFRSMCERSRYGFPEEAAAPLEAWFDAQPRDKGFGNARLARNLFEAAVARHATRVVVIPEPTDEDLVRLLPEDILPQ